VSASDSWSKLEDDFRELSKTEGDWHANRFGTEWRLTGAPGDSDTQSLLNDRFLSLARLAAIKARVPNRSNTLEAWLNCVRDECPRFTIHDGCVINRPSWASAEACRAIGIRDIEFEAIANSEGHMASAGTCIQTVGDFMTTLPEL